MKLHKTLLLKIVEPNEGKRKKLENTIELYAKVLKFYLGVIPKLGMYRIASMDSKSALTFLEFNTVPTKTHPNPLYPIFGGVQTNIRRSAINKAVGMIKSYLSNLLRWHREGKELEHSKPSYPNPKNFSFTYYATDVEFEDVLSAKEFAFVKLKVIDEKGNYEFVNYPILPYRRFYEKLSELKSEGWKLKRSATLIKKGKSFYVALTLEKVVKKVKQERPKYVINVDLNIQRNLACIGIFEIDWEKRESRLYGIKFIKRELTKLAYKRDYLLEEIRLRQVLTGRSPERGDNRKLWRKIYNLNRDIVLKVAKEIDEVAKYFKEKGEVVVVFEKLKGLRGKRGKGKRLNRKLSYWMRKSVQERVEYLAFENGYGIDFVYPHYTSKRCCVCGLLGERFSPNGSKALFGCSRCGYEVNADVNAVFNQHFVYLSHLLHGGGEARSVVRVGVSLKGLRKRRHNLSGASKAMATFAY